MPINKPMEGEYAPYYGAYINKVTGTDLLTALNNGLQQTIAFLQSIPESRLDYRYAEGKWTVKEILLHIMDAERVFAYRALTFARNDKSNLPGFDENAWVPESNAANRSWHSLVDEYQIIRRATIALFDGLTPEAAMRLGKANGKDISVRALGYIIAGHEIHHLQVIKEKYLTNSLV